MQRRKRTRVLFATATIAIAAMVLAACGPAPGPASDAAADVRAGQNYMPRALDGRGQLNFDSYLESNAQMHADRLANGVTNCRVPLAQR